MNTRSLWAGFRSFCRRYFPLKKSLMPFLTVCLMTGCVRGNTAALSASAPAEKNRLVIYTSHLEEVYAPVIKEFEERTGIWVQVETGGTIELLKRISSESAPPRCDVIFGGGVESLYSCRTYFSSYKSSLSEQIPPEYLQKDGLWTPFSIPPVVLIYNSKLIRANPPTGWTSLLDPAWKGKIAFADPEASGSSYTALSTLVQILPGDKEELVRSFFQNLDGRILDQSGQVIDEVADGSCYIGVTLEENALRGIKNGYDIAMVYPSEGTCGIPDGLAVISGSPHEENACKFIDFVLGCDVQTYLTKSCSLRALRYDAPAPDGASKDFLRFPYDITLAADTQKELLLLWNQLTEESETHHSASKETAP